METKRNNEDKEKTGCYGVPTMKQSTELYTFKYIVLFSVLLDTTKCFTTAVVFTLEETEAVKD